MVVFCTSSKGQQKPGLPKQNIKSETKDLTTSLVPYSMVRNIKQARNGDILVASWKGIFRYDGKSFTNLTSKISSPSFWNVLEDRKGNLWFATRDSGVYYYNGKSFKHFTTREGLGSNMVFSIYEDKTGNIWFGASRYDGKSFRNFTTKDGLPNNSIRPIPEDKTGKFWFGTRDNSLVYDGKTFTTKDALPINGVSLVFEDKTGKSWFASGGNIYIYDGKTFTPLTNKDGKAFKDVGNIIEDKKGNILFSNGDGLWRYDGSTFINFSKTGAYAMIEDKEGNIWTTGEVKPTGYWAISRYDQKSLYDKNPTVTEIMSKKGNSSFCGILAANDGSIWVGSVGAESGLYRYDGKAITDFMEDKDKINTSASSITLPVGNKKYFVIDTKESVVTWKGSSIEGAQAGYAYISKGELMIENGQLMGGTVEIEMNKIEGPGHGRDNNLINHLKSPDFFDVKKFPFSKIVITRGASINGANKKVTGKLTIKGITHPVTFPTKLEVKGGIVQANTKLIIDRTKWGIRYNSGKFYDNLANQAISDSIEFNIKIIAKK